MPQNSKRPTVRDVARRAGVSYQTVSRVINNQPGVAVETRDLIMSVVRELDFRPNRAAQMLATQRSRALELLTIYPRSMMLHSPLETMSYVAGSAGYHLVFSVVDPNDLISRLESAASRLVAGLVLIVPNWLCGITDQELIALCGKVPFVQMMARLGAELPSVVYDQLHGSRLIAQHLVDLGHYKIAEIRGPSDSFEADIRHEGWVQTLRANNLDPSLCITAQSYQVESGYQATLHMLAAGFHFTALVAANDRLALGAIHALDEHGIRVPDDVSVVGYDDIEHAAHYLPPLTTVAIDFPQLGKTVVEYLIQRIEQPDLPAQQFILKPELVIRHSTARHS